MEYLLTGKQMRDADRYTTESIGIPAIVLIERAALAVQREALRMTGWKQCVVFCGRGSNGADGYAAARLLLEEGRNVLTVQTGEDPAPGSAAAVEKQICEHLSGSVLRYGSAAWQQKRSGLVQGRRAVRGENNQTDEAERCSDSVRGYADRCFCR